MYKNNLIQKTQLYEYCDIHVLSKVYFLYNHVLLNEIEM